ncbi:MAG: HIT domain-containing protein [Dehalococcoidia bacterium]
MTVVRSTVGRMLFALARGRAVGVVVRWGFAHMSGCLPVARLYETDSVVAFYHPRPAYAVHVLIVPKRGIAGLGAVGAKDHPILGEVVAATQHVVRMLELERRGYRLVVNGGAYQDVGQLHFHLISDDVAPG